VAQGIQPLDPTSRLCGPAFTLRQIPSQDRARWARDELPGSKLIEMADPGQVIVIDAGGRLDLAFWGDNMAAHALQKGLAGTVVDGAVRDSAELVRQRYAVFARGVALLNPHGSIRTTCVDSEPVQLGTATNAIMVAPGDLLIGDRDGLVVVPRGRMTEVLELSKRRYEADQELAAAIESGSSERSAQAMTDDLNLEGLPSREDA
jgi:4-hydroxy-4-methyl-2-oxoglutarate aldolase